MSYLNRRAIALGIETSAAARARAGTVPALVKFLNAHLETTFKSEDYLAWSKSYSETEDIDLEVTDFDEAVAYFLGEKAYLYYKKSNQLDDKLKYEVFGTSYLDGASTLSKIPANNAASFSVRSQAKPQEKTEDTTYGVRPRARARRAHPGELSRFETETSAVLPTGADIDNNFKTITAIMEILDKLSKDDKKLLIENLDVTMTVIKDFGRNKKATYQRK